MGGTGARSADADIVQLRDEVAGLRRALETRGKIEQAKGKLYPSAPASGILAACIQAWHSTSRRVHIVPARSADRSPARAGPTMRLQAIPFFDRLLVTW